MNTIVIIVTVVFLIAAWYAVGKLFNGNEKEDRYWRWTLRGILVGVGCIAIGLVSKNDFIALFGIMFLAFLIGTGFSKTD